MYIFQNTLFGKLKKRYKRFFMDVMLDSGEIVVAHTANTGSMKGLLGENNPVMLAKTNDLTRKTLYDVLAIQVDNHWVGVNTHLPNKIIKTALLEKHPLLKEFHCYETIKAEVKFGENLQSRVDFLLSDASNDSKDFFLEIKNVTLKENNHALFPDSPSVRAQKHIDDLMLETKNGAYAGLIFLVQRNDVDSFSAAKEIDPLYFAKLKEAYNKGLHIKALCSSITPNGIELIRELKLVI